MFESKEYKRSRAVYMVQCGAEYFVCLLLSDAYLAKLLKNVGMSDSLIGIISSIVSLAFVFQLLSLVLMGKIRNAKKTFLAYDTVSQVLFAGIFFVPFLNIPSNIKTIMVVSALLIAYLFKYLVNMVLYEWANSYVEPNKLGRYCAIKEMTSLFSGAVFSLTMGYFFEKLENSNNVGGQFILIGVAILTLCAISFISTYNIKNKIYETNREEYKILDVCKKLFTNKKFVAITAVQVFVKCSIYMTVGFMGIYKTQNLLLGMTFIQIVNVVGLLARFVASKPLGNISDKYSFSRGISVGLIIMIIGFAANIFSTASSVFCVVVFTILYNISQAGVEANLINITFDYVPKELFVQASAVKNSVAGILGFVASILGGSVLAHIEANNNIVFGIELCGGQQVLSVISVLFALVALGINYFFVGKNKACLQ